MPRKAKTAAANSSDSARALRPVSLEAWVTSTRRLLSLEQQEEVQTMRDELATLADSENPNVLTHLTLARYSTGLFGRTVLQFSFPSLSLRQTKPHQFTVGDLVQIRVQKTIPAGTNCPLVSWPKSRSEASPSR